MPPDAGGPQSDACWRDRRFGLNLNHVSCHAVRAGSTFDHQAECNVDANISIMSLWVMGEASVRFIPADFHILSEGNKALQKLLAQGLRLSK
jgi:hypothetical protein